MRQGIAVAGNLIVDHIKTINTLPGRSELVRIENIENSTGGIVCNTGIDLKILDPELPVYALGAAGNDPDGDMVVSRLEQFGIDTSRIIRRGVTAFTDVYAEKSCSCRTFFTFSGASDGFDIDDIDLDKLDSRILHIGYLLMLDSLDREDSEYGTRMARLLHAIQKRGCLTSIDVVSENTDRFGRIILPALRYTDYLIFNEIEGGKTVGISLRDGANRLLEERIPEVLQKLRDAGVSRWVILHCPEGAFGTDENGNYAVEYSKPLPRGYIAGTVGAGDAFCAGALLAAYRGLKISDALVYGNASAQVSLREKNANDGMTSIDEAIAVYNKT